jgi:hypothetical protein
MTKQSGHSKDVVVAWEDLVLSILSVNNYSIEKAYTIADALRVQGLFDPQQLARWDAGEIAKRLNFGGYVRGTYMTGLLTSRLAALGEAIRQHGLEKCSRIITGKDKQEIEALLLPVKGIGPKVLSTFYLLNGIQR